MPKNEQKMDHQSSLEKLNISELSIGKAKLVVKTNILNTIRCWDIGRDLEKQTIHLIGPAGVGKTQICSQIAKELSKETEHFFNCWILTCPVLSRDDFLVPSPIKGKDGEFSKFKMLLSDFIPTEKDSWGIFVIDEFGRGDHYVQQLMWQVQNTCGIHTHKFPKGWFIVCCDNPSDDVYAGMDMLEDAAGLRRMLHVYLKVDVKDFLKHAISSDYHPLVVEFIQTYPTFIYDFDAQKKGSVYANPASYERVSNILWGFENSSGGLYNNMDEIEIMISGLLNVDKTRLFMEFMNNIKVIKPSEIVNDYKKVQPEIKKFREDKNNSKLSSLMDSFFTYLATEKPDYENSQKVLDNIALFLLDCPEDVAASFIANVDSVRESDKETYSYFIKIHNIILKKSIHRDRFQKDFFEALVQIRTKARIT